MPMSALPPASSGLPIESRGPRPSPYPDDQDIGEYLGLAIETVSTRRVVLRNRAALEPLGT